MKIYYAKYYSRNFDFEAFGETKEQALETMYKGLEDHAKQYGLELDWWKVFINDLSVVELELGVCLRDRQPIWSQQ